LKTVRPYGALATASVAVSFVFALSLYAAATSLSIQNQQLVVTAGERDGAYEIWAAKDDHPVIRSMFGAKINHQWIKSTQYPRHTSSESRFENNFGAGWQIKLEATGLPEPDLLCFVRLYDELPYGEIEVKVRNQTGKSVTVQSLRSMEATGQRLVDLGGPDNRDRVLSENFSTDTTTQRIYDLDEAPEGMHRGIWSQLIYNRQSGRSLLFGALTAERLVTILRLQVEGRGSDAKVASFNVDSTGTTEVLLTAETSHLRVMPEEDRIELSLPLSPGKTMSSERLLFATGDDYHAQFESYGAALRRSFSPPSASACLMGWESEKVYDDQITAGYVWSNAQWLAQHLKSAGFNCFHIEPGYAYATGEFATPNGAAFPHGVREVSRDIARLGLTVGGFVVPFHVSVHSWVYLHHKEWLLHNASGKPIRLVNKQGGDFILDVTHPGAQEYIRQTYQTLVHDWGWRTLDIDGMDLTALEGYRYRPNTTALEAIRILLRLIKDAAGNDLMLIGQGAPYLGVAGFVETGRISQDTAHTFASTKEAAPGIAAHYYDHGNLWINDPDCFDVQEQPVPMDMVQGKLAAPLTLDEARASIVVAALSGGKYEIGDDLPTLGAEPERLALVTNTTLLQMAKLGRAATPMDLMTYLPEDEQPSVFFLREDDRQSMLAVFNWTDKVLTHAFKPSELGIRDGEHLELHDALDNDRPMAYDGGAIALKDQPPHSVRLVKIIDGSKPAAPPTITADVPTNAKIAEVIAFSARASENGVPALAYHWDFGDGITAEGSKQSHAYTLAGTYTARLTADGLDGPATRQAFPIVVEGQLAVEPARRSVEPHKALRAAGR